VTTLHPASNGVHIKPSPPSPLLAGREVCKLAADVAGFAAAIFETEDIVEIRRIWPDREAGRSTSSGWFKAGDLASNIKWTAALKRENDAGWGVFIGVNPRKSRGCRDEHGVAVARCLRVDFDGGMMHEEVLARIADAGLPAPTLVVASGHGVHVYWRLAEALSDLAQWRARQKALIQKLGSDDKIHDAPRVMRLPGFTNTKPPLAPCTIVQCHPERRYSFGEFPPAVELERSRASAVPMSGGRGTLSKSTLDFIVNGAAPGFRNGRVFKAAADYHGCGYPQEEAEAKLVPAATAAGLSDVETRAAILSAYSKSRKPSVRHKQASKAESAAVLTPLSEVQSRAVDWLWHGRIALGKVTLIAGDPGLGKSFMTLDLASRVSRGRAFPGADGYLNPAGGVVLLSAEDDLGDTIRPRLEAAGADLTRIVAIEAIQQGELGDSGSRMFDLGRDLAALEAAIQSVPGCRLVIIDPISAYLGDTDSHKNAAVRAVLAPLADLARHLNVAIVAVTHLRKGEGAAMYRTMGSLAFIAAARAAFALARDPDDPTGTRRLLILIKNNIGNDKTGMAFRLSESPASDPERVPKVEWSEEPVTLSADDAIGSSASTRAARNDPIDDASQWLAEFLRYGPVAAADVIQNAENAGISKRTLGRAKKLLGVRTDKQSYSGPWMWAMPGPSLPLPTSHCSPVSGAVATLDECGNLGRNSAEIEPFGHTNVGNLGEGCHTDIAGRDADEAAAVADSSMHRICDAELGREVEHSATPLHAPHVGPSVAKAADRPAEGA